MGASRAVVTPLWAADMAALLRGLRAGRALRGLSSGKKGSPLVLWLYRRAGDTFSRTRVCVCVISAFRTSVLLALADRAKGDHEGRYQQQGTECSSKNGAIRRFVVSGLALPGRPHRWLQGKHVTGSYTGRGRAVCSYTSCLSVSNETPNYSSLFLLSLQVLWNTHVQSPIEVYLR